MRHAARAIAILAAPLVVAPPLAAQPHAISAPSAAPPDNGNWEMPGKNFASTRFSAMRQIRPANVRALQVAFTFSTGNNKGHEAPPLVVGSTMVIVTPFPNVVYALDLARPGAPVKWTFRPKPPSSAQGVACCDVVNRGAAYASGRIFFNTLDGQTIALDIRSGKQLWRTRLGNIAKGETVTMAPLVADGKVLVGNSGGEMGVRGWLTALDAGSGRVVWKAYHTGP